MLCSVWVFFGILARRKPNKYCLWEARFFSTFFYFLVSLVCHSVKFIMKIAVQNADCVFVAYTKIIEGCNFVALLTFNQCQLAEVDKSHRVTAW